VDIVGFPLPNSANLKRVEVEIRLKNHFTNNITHVQASTSLIRSAETKNGGEASYNKTIKWPADTNLAQLEHHRA
jgi:hypothetical protein